MGYGMCWAGQYATVTLHNTVTSHDTADRVDEVDGVDGAASGKELLLISLTTLQCSVSPPTRN